MKVTLRWDNANPPSELTDINVYRSTSPMDPQALPAALATLVSTARSYDDSTVVTGNTYYYRIGMVVSGEEQVSAEKQIYVDTTIAVPTGLWACAVARSGNSNDEFLDFLVSTNTNLPTYEEYFANTIGFGVFAANKGTSGATAGPVSGTIAPFDLSYEFRIHGQSLYYTSGRADMLIEILDSNDIVLAAIRVKRTESDGGVTLAYGPDTGSLTTAPTVGDSGGISIVHGRLYFDSNALHFEAEPKQAQSSPDGNNVLAHADSITYEVDLSGASKLRFTDVEAYTYGGNDRSDVWAYLLGVRLFIDAKAQLSKTSSQATISWNELVSPAVDQVVLYRDTSPVDTQALPAPLTTLSGGVESYVDTVPDNTANYYYKLDVQSLGESNFSRDIKAWFDPFKVNLQAFYKMESDAGGVLVDESVNANDATINGTHTLVTGKDGQAIEFSGLTSHADTGLDAEIDNLFATAGNSWTVACWFKCGPQSDDDGVIMGRGGGTGTAATFAMFVPISGGASGRTPDEFWVDIRGNYTSTGVTVTDNKWHFGLVTWDGITGTIRLDGGEYPMNRGSASLQSGEFLAIGAHRGLTSASGGPNSGTTFLGAVDHVRVFNRALDLNERTILFAEFDRFYGFSHTFDSDLIEVTLSWSLIDSGEVENVVIYRDTAPIDTGALPTPLTTLTGGATSYTDNTVSADSYYYYLIDVQTTGAVSHYSDNLGVTTATSLLQFENQGTMVWFDASDLSTLFQDTAGTVPVTGDNQPVQRWNDKSSNGFDAIIDTGTATYRTDGSRHWIQFNQARFKFTQFINGTMDRTAAFLAQPQAWYGNSNDQAPLLDLYDGTGTASGGDWTCEIENDGLWIRVSGNNQWQLTTSLNTTYNLLYEWGLSLGTDVANSRVYNGGTALTSLGGSSATINTITSTNSYIGGSLRQTANYFTGEMQQVFLLNAVLSDTDRDAVVQLIEAYR